MLLADLVAVSESVSATRSRSEKIELLSAMLQRLTPEEAPVAVSYLSGSPRQSPLGVGYATVHAVEADPAEDARLELLEVDDVLASVAAVAGPGSKAVRESSQERCSRPGNRLR